MDNASSGNHTPICANSVRVKLIALCVFKQECAHMDLKVWNGPERTNVRQLIL
jgi:hypothetical protein